VDFELLYRYFTTSLDSVDDAPGDEFELAIANSVIWACILDEALENRLGRSYTDTRSGNRSGRVLDGLRLARNAIVHGQTFAIRPGGMAFPLDYPLYYGPPVWKSAAELMRSWTPRFQGPGFQRLRATYEQEIAGTNIGAPLWTAREWLDHMREHGWKF